MKQRTRMAEAGFTLIEIMIVVVIIGILAAIAIPLYLDWVNHSKHAEARENLRIVADGALTYYQEEHGDVIGATTNHYPDGSLCTEGGADANGNRTDPGATDWGHPVWKTWRFTVSKPHYFRYCYNSGGGGETFAATADAALSGDGAIDVMYCVRGESGPSVGGVFEIDPGVGCEP